MTFYSFCLLSPAGQRDWVLQHGTYLAQRWEDEGGISRYQVAAEGRGCFVEVGVDEGQGQAMVLRNCVSAVPLQEYAH